MKHDLHWQNPQKIHRILWRGRKSMDQEGGQFDRSNYEICEVCTSFCYAKGQCQWSSMRKPVGIQWIVSTKVFLGVRKAKVLAKVYVHNVILLYLLYVFLLPWDKEQKENRQIWMCSLTNVFWQSLQCPLSRINDYPNVIKLFVHAHICIYTRIYTCMIIMPRLFGMFLFSEHDGVHKQEFWSTLTYCKISKDASMICSTLCRVCMA